MKLELDELYSLKKTFKDNSMGLITGCFDILHIGHISLFEFAKSNVDILIVGIDSDLSVKINKGHNRPYFDQNTRLKMVDSIKYVDYTFIVDHQFKYKMERLNEFYLDLYKQLGVTHLITNKEADSRYMEKQRCARKLGINFILQDENKLNSSSRIINDLKV